SDSTLSLYAALAIIICGYGLFKSNISCLLGELYAPDDNRRDGTAANEGRGIAELRAHLQQLPARSHAAQHRFRLAIDRAFTVKG
ncbi:hypothetical protein MJM28_28955, partial [Salmonella enterica subsp. enterica serovar Montevideo]|nr:hypothetical protein [Salmonella enterica subsp. enterica serovar Montevideo]